jgi:hypothetical protein
MVRYFLTENFLIASCGIIVGVTLTLSLNFRPPDIAPFYGGNPDFCAPRVRTNTCPVFGLAAA